MTESDALLLERLKQDDQVAFETLFHRHYRAVYGPVYRLMGSREAAKDLAARRERRQHTHRQTPMLLFRPK